MLIKYKANLSATDFNTTFPLQRAAAIGNYEIAKLLVDNGADKQQKTQFGKTALMWAEENGHTQVAALLKR
jgi:ankyrin repeat protein